MDLINGSLAGSKDNRNPTLTHDFLRAEYCRNLGRWQVTKSEVDRRAVRESYKRFGGTFCDAAFVEAEATRKFGVA